MTDFEKEQSEIRAFKNMLEKCLDNAFNEWSKGNGKPFNQLYNSYFTLTFGAWSCKLSFGAIEYNEITNALENILKEHEQ